jgi:hypothetical protein
VIAIIAIIAGFTMPVAGIVLGIVALSQIRRTGEEGRASAITGIVAASVLSLFSVASLVVWLSLFFTAMSQSGFAPNA